MRNQLLIVLLSLFITSCGKTPIEPEIIKVHLDDYFPLSIGYWWKYQTASGSLVGTMAITKKARFGDHEYFGRAWINETDTSDYEYFRSDSAGRVFTYDFELGDQLIYDFTTEVGKYWEFPSKIGGGVGPYHITIESASDTVLTSKWAFYNCLRISFDVPNMIDEEHWQWFVKGVGLVKWSFWGGKMKDGEWVNERILIDTNLIDP